MDNDSDNVIKQYDKNILNSFSFFNIKPYSIVDREDNFTYICYFILAGDFCSEVKQSYIDSFYFPFYLKQYNNLKGSEIFQIIALNQKSVIIYFKNDLQLIYFENYFKLIEILDIRFLYKKEFIEDFKSMLDLVVTIFKTERKSDPKLKH